jgi:hypothetical protein
MSKVRNSNSEAAQDQEAQKAKSMRLNKIGNNLVWQNESMNENSLLERSRTNKSINTVSRDGSTPLLKLLPHSAILDQGSKKIDSRENSIPKGSNPRSDLTVDNRKYDLTVDNRRVVKRKGSPNSSRLSNRSARHKNLSPGSLTEMGANHREESTIKIRTDTSVTELPTRNSQISGSKVALGLSDPNHEGQVPRHTSLNHENSNVKIKNSIRDDSKYADLNLEVSIEDTVRMKMDAKLADKNNSDVKKPKPPSGDNGPRDDYKRKLERKRTKDSSELLGDLAQIKKEIKGVYQCFSPIITGLQHSLLPGLLGGKTGDKLS